MTALTDRLDPITLEVVRNKLDAVADEMELAILKSSHSAIVKEALDASAAIFDPTGRQVAQAAASPIHLGMIIPAVRRFVEVFPPPTMRDGDVYVLNDPFDGGTHLPDIVMTLPVFSGARLVALATAITHHQDMGGRSPGSTPVDAREIYQEGLRIPALKLWDQGRPNTTLFDLIARNVRIPDVVLGDLHGQFAACNVGKAGVLSLVSRLGADSLAVYIDALLDRAERMARSAIATIPDGRYSFVDFLDNDGVDLDNLVRIEATITVSGSDLTVDFEGSSEQVSGPINCVPASTLSAVYYVVRAVVGSDVPKNAGCYRPIDVRMPLGSIVNARPPAAVNSRSVVVRRIVDAMLGALNQAMPGRLPAASNGHPLVMSMGGIDPSDGHPYVTAEIAAGGMGARPTKDGIDTIQTDTSNAQNIPAEALELEFPIRVGHWRLRRDSGGIGTFRGGLGFDKRFEVLRGEVRVSHRGERHRTAPWGLFGGGPGATSESTLTKAGEPPMPIPSKLEFSMRPGDVLDVSTTGGGGYGDPLGRDVSAVLADVLDAKVSRERAGADYGVVIDGRSVDVSATETRRAELRRARGPITWTFDRGPTGGPEGGRAGRE